MLRFAVINMIVSEAVCMTPYINSDRDNNRVEFGSIWNSKSIRCATLNTKCKLMLLEHAYEKLGCICVEFWTHFINHQSEICIEIKRGLRAFSDQMQYRKTVQLETKQYIYL